MDFNSKKAIYLQITDLICENILLGKMEEDSRVQSVRELAVMLQVNPNTVMRAYSFLQDEGIMYNKRGIGYFIAEGARALVLKVKKSEFIEREMPEFFKESRLYGITPDSMKELYQKYLEEQSENQ